MTAMQDFEVPRYKAALTAFSHAFDDGYAEGLTQIASGTDRRSDIESVFHVDVPRDNVFDDNWSQHVPHFWEAGRAAALAIRRKGMPKLDAGEVSEESRVCFMENKFRWYVILNPSS
jgi:hypothetical protein